MRTGIRVHAVRLAILGVALIAAPVAVGGDDFTARLNGNYAFVQTRVCSSGASGAPGINEDLVLLSPNSLRTAALRGVMTFDGHGSGTFQTDELQLNASVTSPGQQQTGVTATTCDLSYTVDADGRAVINLLACAGTGVLGGVKDLHFTASDISLDGRLSSDGKTLLLSDVSAPVSTVTTVETGQVSVRVCSRTGTAVRVR